MKGQTQNIGTDRLDSIYVHEKRGLPLMGEKFPPIEVQTTHGKLRLPYHFSGKWFVLFSHPGDFTPVCTTEFVAFAKKQDEFQRLNCELIGLSIDQVFSYIKWIEWIDLKLKTDIRFPIISDDRGKVASTLGMLHPRKGTNTVRAVFVVDDQGVIRLMLHYPQEIGRNIDEVLRIVKALQVSDEQNAATPADWPNNALIGDAVIIPPPTDEKTAIQRLSEHDCYDWWFCHKRLNGRK